jgi:hypothetical protein
MTSGVIADIHAHIVDLRYVRELTALLDLDPERTGDGKVLLRKDGTNGGFRSSSTRCFRKTPPACGNTSCRCAWLDL